MTAVSKSNVHPLCEYALTLEYLQEPLNYHTMYQGSNELWLPFFTVSLSGDVTQDAFLFEPEEDGTSWIQMTWNRTESPGSTAAFINLANVGIVPRPDGSWAERFAVANAMSARYIQSLLKKS